MASRTSMDRSQEMIALLSHPRSQKRRSAAKRLRRLQDPRACSAIGTALERELEDSRTWETKYHLIMALGSCGCDERLPFLEELATRQFESSMLYSAIGGAVVRLARSFPEDAEPVLRLLHSGNAGIIYGALAAVASLRLCLNDSAVREIIAFARAPTSATSPYFCDFPQAVRQAVTVAAAGWKGGEVDAFLAESVRSAETFISEAAKASLLHQYYRYWREL